MLKPNTADTVIAKQDVEKGYHEVTLSRTAEGKVTVDPYSTKAPDGDTILFKSSPHHKFRLTFPNKQVFETPEGKYELEVSITTELHGKYECAMFVPPKWDEAYEGGFTVP